MSLNILKPEERAADALHQLIGFSALMRMAMSGVDLDQLMAPLANQVMANPRDANALMDLAVVLQFKHQRALALELQALALTLKRLYHRPADRTPAGLRLLAIMGPGDLMANTPLECLLEGSDVALDILYVVPGLPLPSPLPDHDLVFVGIAESDENQSLLESVAALLDRWRRPVVNRPERIANLSRDGAAALLRGLPGTTMPTTRRVDRSVLAEVAAGRRSMADLLGEGDFPIILRPVGSHTGQNLHRLEDRAALAACLETVPGEEFFAARFVDYRGQDGLFRKCRLVMIDGRPFVCHLAVSEHWMIHYLNAGMATNAAKRAEEARFMADFDSFARRHEAAFRAIHERTGLDYLGLDCGETREGELLIFEIDTSMVVHDMDPVDLYPYKHAQMMKVFDAFRTLLGRAERPRFALRSATAIRSASGAT